VRSSAIPAFTSRVSTVTGADLGSSYHAGCPVGPAQLRELHLSYWGFDGEPHTGALIVNAAVVDSVRSVFRTLYIGEFPIRRMEPVAAFGGSDPESMAADNTSAFNCRDAVAPGPPRWSVHAYGEAVDVNTVENPYVEGGDVQPPAGSAFRDRSQHRSGMAYPGGVLVSAFAAVGWPWGGRWADPDYQHFSATGG
jgi:D-alanyl-D-alanine carboxypeptidase